MARGPALWQLAFARRLRDEAIRNRADIVMPRADDVHRPVDKFFNAWRSRFLRALHDRN